VIVGVTVLDRESVLEGEAPVEKLGVPEEDGVVVDKELPVDDLLLVMVGVLVFVGVPLTDAVMVVDSDAPVEKLGVAEDVKVAELV